LSLSNPDHLGARPITSRAGVSPSSKTDWIIFAFVGSDHAALLSQIDDLAQLNLGRERPVPQAPPGVIALPTTPATG